MKHETIRQKMKKVVYPVAILSLAIYTISPFSHAVEEYKAGNKEKDVIVLYKNDEGKDIIIDKAVEVDAEMENINVVSATVKQKDIAKLEKDKNIIAIEEDRLISIQGEISVLREEVNSAVSESDFWNVKAVNAEQAWADGYTGKGVKVAVIDTGISSHSDLVISGGVSVVDYTTSYADDNGHGTHVAGTIGAKRNNYGVVGIAPDAQIYAVKAVGENGLGYVSDVFEGIDWSIANNMDIVNLSLGDLTNMDIYREVLQTAYNRGLLLVGASGNDDDKVSQPNTVAYPAKYPEVIAVGAITKSASKASFSGKGEELEFVAPGVEIVSTYLNGTYAVSQGTSMASPHVAGLLAILHEKHPNYTNQQLRLELQKYAKDLGQTGRDNQFGFGQVIYKSTPANNNPVNPQPVNPKPVEPTPVEPTPTNPSPTPPNPTPQDPSHINHLMMDLEMAPNAQKYEQVIAMIGSMPESSQKNEFLSRAHALRDLTSKQAQDALTKYQTSTTLMNRVAVESALERLVLADRKQTIQKQIDATYKFHEAQAKFAVKQLERNYSSFQLGVATGFARQLQDGSTKTNLLNRINQAQQKAKK